MSSPPSLDDRPTSAFRQQGLGLDSATSAASYLSAGAISVYVLIKVLELLGYPVWLWLLQFATMVAAASPIEIPRFLFDPEPESDDARQSAMPSGAGNVLSGVFGLNSGSLLGKGMRGVTGALSKSYRNVPAGLGNYNNSCYQNSVIQGMASLPSLRDYLSRATSEYCALDMDTTNGALFDLINKLNNPELHGQQFWIRGTLKSMSTFQQQDAQEYYSKIMDALDKEVEKASNSKRRSSASLLSTTKGLSDLLEATVEKESGTGRIEEDSAPAEQPLVTPNPLDGLLAQRVGCVNCGFTEGLSLIPFNCITVPLGRNWAYDIGDCLDEYTSLEYIEGVECAKCTLLHMKQTLGRLKINPETPLADRLQAVQEALEEEDFDDKTVIKKCNVLKKNWTKSTKSRQAVIARAPKSLVVHVNRSIFDEMTGAQYKNNASVMYPKILDLNNWCLGTRPSESQRPDDSVEEAWPRDPRQSMIRGKDAEPSTTSPFQYTLKAAIIHFGNHGNGHYVCYRQHPIKTTVEQDPEDEEEPELKANHDQWWRLSDEIVHEVSEHEALHQSNVFMLFYERIDAGSSPMPPPEARPLEASAPVSSEQIARPVVPTQSSDAEASNPTAAEVLDSHAECSAPSPLVSPSDSPRLPQRGADSSTTPAEISQVETSMATDNPANPISPLSQPMLPEDAEMSEARTTNYDSEGAPSTLLTSDDDVEMDIELPKEPSNQSRVPSRGPHHMRTAGNVGPSGGEGVTASLPMVSAK